VFETAGTPPAAHRFSGKEETNMSKHNHDSMQLTQNQNNEMSDDPGDGSRNSDTLGRDGAATPVERAPEQDAQDQEAIEAFGRRGGAKD
jgi:hypothetical protein